MKSVVVGTAGHIDHGKSALVRALTGTDPDRLKEEQARGITIDLGFAHAVIDGVNFAFVDVPGHERFVKNMLAGIGGIDLVALVVAADESVMPQTREHFDICRLLQVPIGVVALTKSDLVDADTLELARLEIRELVAGSFLDGAAIVPVSSRAGSGLDDLRRALADATARVGDRGAGTVARLPIDRVFSMKGFGTVVTGTLVAGRIDIDDELALAPGERHVKVRGLQVHGQKQTSVTAGHRTAVNVTGVEVSDVSRGQSLVTRGAFETTRVADAVVDVLASAKPLKHGQRVRFHQGTAELLGRVSIVGPDRASVDAGARAYVRLRLESSAVLARGDRYILRAYSPPITIAGGAILDPQPPRTAIRTAAALERLRRLEGEPVPGMIADAGAAGLAVSALVTRAAVDPRDVDATIAALVAAKQAERAGDRLVAPTVLARVREAIVHALTQVHETSPLSEGMPRDELRERALAAARLPRRGGGGAKGGGHVAVFDRALDDLARDGRVVVRDRVALATHKVSLSPEEDRVREAIERAFRTGGLKPPEPSAIAADAGVAPAVADRVLKLLQRQKVLVRVDTLLFHDEALKGLKAEVAAMKAAGGQAARIDVATFKERFGVSRKFAIPLLEYLDRERVTRRVGDARVIL
ncbi:MAG TPA: selenocysteine-specific translation elongation factor [Vicinamibacterales bacterium]|nr:selenocysteine-specific translation elongation factor [Vicinamibacterales bacterium]